MQYIVLISISMYFFSFFCDIHNQLDTVIIIKKKNNKIRIRIE